MSMPKFICTLQQSALLQSMLVLQTPSFSMQPSVYQLLLPPSSRPPPTSSPLQHPIQSPPHLHSPSPAGSIDHYNCLYTAFSRGKQSRSFRPQIQHHVRPHQCKPSDTNHVRPHQPKPSDTNVRAQQL